MSEEKHSGDRVPAWDGDKRQWKPYLRDVELYLEPKKLDVDFSHGARLLSLRPSNWIQYDAQRVKTKTLVRELSSQWQCPEAETEKLSDRLSLIVVRAL